MQEWRQRGLLSGGEVRRELRNGGRGADCLGHQQGRGDDHGVLAFGHAEWQKAGMEPGREIEQVGYQQGGDAQEVSEDDGYRLRLYADDGEGGGG